VSRARLAALLALALAAPAARAGIEEASAVPPKHNGSFELGVGSYRPNIDSEFPTSPGPYQQVFGSGNGWMFRAAGAWAFYSGVGSAEVGLRTGYFVASGRGLYQQPDGTWARSGDGTSLNIVPTSATLTYRFDYLAEHRWVPLSPYARVALERYNWWVTNGAGSWVKKGATNGYSWALGLALQLDWFDRDSQRDLDRETGIKHTYLFFDATWSRIDDFGSKSSWDLSGAKTQYAGGLMFVF